jgi:uncharacterized protein YjbJ (UPF0337 family)
MTRDLLGRGQAMTLLNRIRNRSRITRGRAKQQIGRATGNRKLQAHGVADRVSGNARQFGEDVKKEVRHAGRGLDRALHR